MRVLHIEDSENDAALIRRQLEFKGDPLFVHRIDSADQMRAALAESARDVILSDAALPQFSAREALRILKDSGLDVPLIVVSGEIGEEAAVQLVRDGAGDYVMKDRLQRLRFAIDREIRETKLRVEHRRSTKLLQHSEARLTLALRAVSMGVWEWDIVTNKLTWSRECTAIFRVKKAMEKLPEFEALAHPEDWPAVLAKTREAIENRDVISVRYRILPPDGSIRWVENLAITTYAEDGRPLFMTGTVRDVTAEKDAELAAANVSARLEAARESERRNLAREIHDELGGLATLAQFKIYQLSQLTPQGSPQAAVLEAVRLDVQAFSLRIRDVAAELHPPLLSSIGLSAALGALAASYESAVQVKTALSLGKTTLTDTEKIVFYRVAQEALTNSVRHSGAVSVELRLEKVDGGWRLTIRDSGKGFDPKVPTKSLGLVGMRDRARTIGATLRISSSATGTTVTLHSQKHNKGGN